MENNKHVFAFNVTRSNNNDDNIALLECFSVPEGGEYSVSVHEIHYGVVQEHVCTQVNNVTVWITEGMPVVCNNTTKITLSCRFLSGVFQCETSEWRDMCLLCFHKRL